LTLICCAESHVDLGVKRLIIWKQSSRANLAIPPSEIYGGRGLAPRPELNGHCALLFGSPLNRVQTPHIAETWGTSQFTSCFPDALRPQWSRTLKASLVWQLS
jgi:hypothetical protein